MKTLLVIVLSLAVLPAFAQLSTNPDKFLGNITTRGRVNAPGIEYASLWNQITPENESKWGSVEGRRNHYNWQGCDNAYRYAREHGFPFKFHTLVWGAQYPRWMDTLSVQEQYREIVEWMDAIKLRYPDLDMIDVVNEGMRGHQPAPFREALGGGGTTGYDWIIKAFQMASERWPDAILIYNDYNTFQWNTKEFIHLVKVLRDAGAPIDAYGCQCHDLGNIKFDDFKRVMHRVHDALQLPMYASEYDIATYDDAHQLQQYKDQISYMWEQDYVAGVTLWGYIYGSTWTRDGNSGIIKEGQDRPAMTWMREYMATPEARSARSPFPGMKKEASVYIKPQSLIISLNEPSIFTIYARLRTQKIKRVEFYVDDTLVAKLKKAPYTLCYTPTREGVLNLKAIVYDTKGNCYERVSQVTVKALKNE